MTSPIRGTFQVQFTAKSPFNRLEAVLAVLPGSTMTIVNPTPKGYVVVFRFPWEGRSDGDLAAAVDQYSREVDGLVRHSSVTFLRQSFTFLQDDKPAPQPTNPDALVVRGVVVGANVDGGPLDGTHLQIEKPSSKYPWRLHLTEGAQSGRKAVWSLPLEGVDRNVAGALLGTPVRITIERDPDAKFS